MSKNVDNRTRVQAGIKTGGQFAAEAHQEPHGVLLTRTPSPQDQAVLAAVGDLVRTNANVEVGRWQRRMDKGRYGYEHESTEPMPSALFEAVRQAEGFEALPRDEQEKLMDTLGLSVAKHMLEPGQTLGTDRIHVGEGLNLEDGNIAMTLAAQNTVHEAGISGTVTLTDIGDVSEFTVQDANVTHSLRVGSGLLSFAAKPEDEEDYARRDWLDRADIGSYGGSIFEKGHSERLRSHYEGHREYAVMMDVMASSPFADYADNFGELDRGARTATLTSDGTESVLDVSGDEPVLKTEDEKPLHPSMTRGYLDHMAAQTGHANRDAFVSSLREVFRETDRRFIR
ncbi:hypothetical protein [Arthrobacter sp. UYCo732]|uniref:hypothetical protein n=1 Tax=Arthrobacter sp. UYCo732 TaxID=3156336 RepID=UPI00339562E2